MDLQYLCVFDVIYVEVLFDLAFDDSVELIIVEDGIDKKRVLVAGTLLQIKDVPLPIVRVILFVVLVTFQLGLCMPAVVVRGGIFTSPSTPQNPLNSFRGS
jgi:hypothetical protein